jgi:hypothetical protein
MKLLLLSDLHLREDWMAWAAAQPVDVLLIAGDVLGVVVRQVIVTIIEPLLSFCHNYQPDPEPVTPNPASNKATIVIIMAFFISIFLLGEHQSSSMNLLGADRAARSMIRDKLVHSL